MKVRVPNDPDLLVYSSATLRNQTQGKMRVHLISPTRMDIGFRLIGKVPLYHRHRYLDADCQWTARNPFRVPSSVLPTATSLIAEKTQGIFPSLNEASRLKPSIRKPILGSWNFPNTLWHTISHQGHIDEICSIYNRGWVGTSFQITIDSA